MPKFHLFVNNTKYETMEDKSDAVPHIWYHEI